MASRFLCSAVPILGHAPVLVPLEAVVSKHMTLARSTRPRPETSITHASDIASPESDPSLMARQKNCHILAGHKNLNGPLDHSSFHAAIRQIPIAHKHENMHPQKGATMVSRRYSYGTHHTTRVPLQAAPVGNSALTPPPHPQGRLPAPRHHPPEVSRGGGAWCKQHHRRTST